MVAPLTAAALLDALAALNLSDALAVNAFNWSAWFYVRPLDAPRCGRYLMAEQDGRDVLVPRAPNMLSLPDLRARIMVEAMARGDAL